MDETLECETLARDVASGDTGPRDQRVGMKCTLVEGVRDAVCMPKNLYTLWKLRNGAEVKKAE